MKITKIEAQVKAKGRYSVFVDEKFSFGISELGLINAGLRVGQDLSKEQLEQLKDKAALDKIYNQALSLIARRQRSRWEIEDYLKRKGVDPETSEQLISELTQRGFINDRTFARAWVENRRLLKAVSKRKLQLELRAKRLSDTVIAEALAEDEVEEYEVLLQEIAKKRRQSRYADDLKLMQYLARQGYRYEDIKRALSDNAG